MSIDVSSEPSFGSTPRGGHAGLNYQGRHRSPRYPSVCRPGALVVEPTGPAPSSVVRQIDTVTALVRHVGTCDDHPVPIGDLVPLAEAARGQVQ